MITSLMRRLKRVNEVMAFWPIEMVAERDWTGCLLL